MGFSVKLAPGLRVGVSSRGVRTSIGPRVSRVHLGAGGLGVSTGAGPVGYYKHLGGSPGGRRTSGGTAAASRQLAAATREQAANAKEEAARQLRDAIAYILELHRETFPVATRQVIPIMPPLDAPATFARHKAHALKSTSAFNRKERKAALLAAHQAAEREIDSAIQTQSWNRQGAQAAADAHWQALEACDPDTVLAQLEAAFNDNDAAASAVGVDGTEISLIVVVPSEAAVPDRVPNVTAAGNVTLKALTKTERAVLYKSLVCGYLLVTLKEAFAVVPALTGAQIVAVRAGAQNSYGTVQPEVVLAAHCDRSSLDGVLWDRADSVQIFSDCLSSKLISEDGRTGALRAIPIGNEPQLAALLEVIGIDEATN